MHDVMYMHCSDPKTEILRVDTCGTSEVLGLSDRSAQDLQAQQKITLRACLYQKLLIRNLQICMT